MRNVLQVGRTQVGGQSTHLPLKVNAAGVIPVIFAVSFIITPHNNCSFLRNEHDVTLGFNKHLIILNQLE